MQTNIYEQQTPVYNPPTYDQTDRFDVDKAYVNTQFANSPAYDAHHQNTTNSHDMKEVINNEKSERYLQKSEQRATRAKQHAIKKAFYHEERVNDATIALTPTAPLRERGKAFGSVFVDAMKEFAEACMEKIDGKLAERDRLRATINETKSDAPYGAVQSTH